MQAIGIISEYNPFHNGHAYQIARAKEAAALPVICAMSGNYVQRGEPAMLDKFQRARMAVSCGASLVLELPTPWACSTAQRFAAGGVELLSRLGVVSYLSFGSESARLDAIRAAAELIDREGVNVRIRELMAGAIDYATARQQAVTEADAAAGALLSSPNDILGIEYLRAIRARSAAIQPLPIRREGAAHDGGAKGDFASASELRRMLLSGEAEAVRRYLPPAAYAILREAMDAGEAPVSQTRLDAAILSALRRMHSADFAVLPDVSEGLEFRLAAAAQEAVDPMDFCDRVKTRRYSHARIRRIMMAAFLGMKKELQTRPIPYARVLAFDDDGRALLREIREKGDLPIIAKAADGRTLGGDVAAYLEFEALADDLFALAYPERETRGGGRGWTKSPVYVRELTVDS
ncbi:MAG: nucleotidyltransferase family protein [Ruminococcaceae bacterium]|nr:nucleotidyltransferase family protein [Oscillospiraceae bacterium]